MIDVTKLDLSSVSEADLSRITQLVRATRAARARQLVERKAFIPPHLEEQARLLAQLYVIARDLENFGLLGLSSVRGELLGALDKIALSNTHYLCGVTWGDPGHHKNGHEGDRGAAKECRAATDQRRQDALSEFIKAQGNAL